MIRSERANERLLDITITTRRLFVVKISYLKLESQYDATLIVVIG